MLNYKKRIAVIALLLIIGAGQYQLRAQPTISFTFDDGVTDDMPGYPFEIWNKMLLDNLDHAGIKAIFFVTGDNKTDLKGQALLQSWSDRGHRIGNHTMSHLNYGSRQTTYKQFASEFVKTDSIITQYAGFIPMFRFPYLKEGDTREKIDSFRALLHQRDYRNGHVTIDASDWYISSRLRMRLRKIPGADIEGFRKHYLDHLFERATYYDDLAYKVTGRHIHHTLLLHHNLAAALFIDDLAAMLKSKGWKIIPAEEAYRDPVFEKQPSNIPAGESLIWALAKESGKFEQTLRYPAEDGEYEKARMDALGL
jgi:peptidoglycan/xylan/chitin deacetylase (PgdA/CDA1 family)